MVVLGIISSVVRDERVDGTSLADSLGALVLILVTPKGAGTTRLGGLLENAPHCAVFTLTQVKVILSGLALFCDVTTDRAFFAACVGVVVLGLVEPRRADAASRADKSKVCARKAVVTLRLVGVVGRDFGRVEEEATDRAGRARGIVGDAAVLVVPCAADRAVGRLVGELSADGAAETVLGGVVVLCGVGPSVVEEVAPGRAPLAGGVVLSVRVLRLSSRADRAVGDAIDVRAALWARLALRVFYVDEARVVDVASRRALRATYAGVEVDVGLKAAARAYRTV